MGLLVSSRTYSSLSNIESIALEKNIDGAYMYIYNNDTYYLK